MLRIGICDDQMEARDALRFQIEKVIREGAEQIVYEFSTGRVQSAGWKSILEKLTFCFWMWR